MHMQQGEQQTIQQKSFYSVYVHMSAFKSKGAWKGLKSLKKRHKSHMYEFIISVKGKKYILHKIYLFLIKYYH